MLEFLFTATNSGSATTDLGVDMIKTWIFIGVVIPFIVLFFALIKLFSDRRKGITNSSTREPIENISYDKSLLYSVHDKLADGLGMESLTEEEKDALKRYGIKY